MGNRSRHKKEHGAVPADTPDVALGETAAETTVPGREPEEDLRARLEAREKEAADNYDRYLRAAAELDNYRKRAARDREDSIKYGNEKLIKDILPILDSLDRALHQASDLSARNNFEAFQQGLELIHTQILGCLERHGVAKIGRASCRERVWTVV